ncbi:SEL1-like repeat protein [Methylomonas paludis]|uniref:SEL1-like repeat protein n=1 Tax=Methylomonas paludis TaxID=1173101 RepID=A0A975MR73_9GAMM|nr:SEL1-like repeat protein [Methylomonas paludis]QWF72415.1 SEL1-like repeat protein [Methylomonas paludis]
MQVLNGHFGVLVSAKLNSDGHVAATSSEDGTARLWNADSGEQLHILNGRDEIDMLAQIKPDDMQRITKFVYSVKFNQDGSRVLTIAADGIARLWNVASGLKLFELEGVGYDENAAQFTADGKRIFTTLINEVKIWNAENGAELQVLKGREYNFNLARFSGDGQRIVTASDDNTVRLWDADTGKVLLELTGHTAEVNAAEFTQNAQKLVTASRDGTIRLWDLANFQAKVQIDYARAAELEVLSPEQRDKLFLSQQDTAEMAGQNACDALAAEPFDTDNPNFRKIKYQEIEAKQAIPACRQAVAEDSHTIRYQFQLALALKQDNQYDEALQLADQACEKSYAAACRLAAQLVGAAQGTPANPSRALELFKRAATLGNLAAANELAQLFWDGLNLPDDHLTIPVDRPAALQLWDNAANKGIPQALAALAQRYELGEELPKDLEKALYYHALSAKQFEFYGLNDLAKFEASRRGSLARRMNPELVAGIWHKQVIPWQPTQ